MKLQTGLKIIGSASIVFGVFSLFTSWQNYMSIQNSCITYASDYVFKVIWSLIGSVGLLIIGLIFVLLQF